MVQQNASASNGPVDENFSVLSTGGMPDGVKLALVLIIACVVCAVSISWVKPFLPEGNYLVVFFLPFAFVGLIVGLIVTNILNVMYKGLSPKHQD